ncbi:MAG: hypothetical protein P1U74_10890 [Legionellaceae bacterium]|nr:hypothetical protein [Legionellaceae bacterium]
MSFEKKDGESLYHSDNIIKIINTYQLALNRVTDNTRNNTKTAGSDHIWDDFFTLKNMIKINEKYLFLMRILISKNSGKKPLNRQISDLFYNYNREILFILLNQIKIEPNMSGEEALKSIHKAVNSDEFKNKVRKLEKNNRNLMIIYQAVAITFVLISFSTLIAALATLSIPLLLTSLLFLTSLFIPLVIYAMFGPFEDIKMYNTLISSFDDSNRVLPKMILDEYKYVDKTDTPDLKWKPACTSQDKSHVIGKFFTKNTDDKSLSDLVEVEYKSALNTQQL